MKQEHPYLLCIKDWIFSTILSNFKFIPLIFCYTIYIYIYIYISESILKSLKHRRSKIGAAPTLDSWRHSDTPPTRWFAPFFFRFTPTCADSSQNLLKLADIGRNLPNHHSWTLFNLPNQNPPFRYFSKYTQKSQKTSCKSTLIRNLCTWPSI